MTPHQTRRDHADTDRQTYGLHALGLRSEQLPLPLKVIDARFEVSGDCAEVTIEQIFEFDGPNPVDVLYTFPLPEDASVYRCVMTVGGRKVAAVVKSLEDAREDYRKARVQGRRAALVESVRDNLFELQLGNVQPGDRITISLAYVSPVQADGTRRRLRIPVCPGVRFIPGKPAGVDGGTDLVPDAARLLPQRIGGDHPDAVAFYCAGTLLFADGVESPSHEIEMRRDDSHQVVTVSLGEDSEVPDRDFILTWERPCETLALMGTDDPEYMICSFQAPNDFGLMERGARDIHFLLDSSGSMDGANWIALIEAVELALAALAESDRFAITLFSDSIQPLTDGLVAANDAKIRAVMRQLRRLTPDGGTQFTLAFEHAIHAAKAARRPVIVVITDGQCGDEARACEVARDCGIEVHAIGIDANVNEAALRKIARRTRGTCSLAVPGEDLDQIIHQLVGNLLCPMLERISAGPQWSLVGHPPSVRPGQAAMIPLRRNPVKPGIPAPHEVELEMSFSDGSRRRETLTVRIARGMAPIILAAKARITACLDDGETKEAVELACHFNVICEGAAFIAIDEAEQVPVARVVLEQPSQTPEFSVRGLVELRYARYQGRDVTAGPPRRIGGEDETPVGPAFCLANFPASAVAESHDRDLVYDYKVSPSRLLAIASWVTCFNREAWMELMKDYLIPWASEDEQLGRFAKLERLILWLEGISQTGWRTGEIVKQFEVLLPSLDGEALNQTRVFLQNFEKQNIQHQP
ncbi:MAG: VIT domain-containing protein [Verrucomicrobiota bacterium]